MIAAMPTTAVPLWPLALLAGVLPLVATVVATAVSMHAGLVPACNPFWDGCTSISRAAREGLATPLFRLLVLPAATLQALVWLLVARWLRAEGHGSRWIAPLGLLAGVALALYASFLGTDGAAYRWLRQHGTVGYFGFTCLNLLLTGRALQRRSQARRSTLPRRVERTFVALAGVLVLLGLGNALVAAALGAPLKARVENVTEWWGALVFVVGFAALAALWRHERVALGLVADRAPRDPKTNGPASSG